MGMAEMAGGEVCGVNRSGRLLLRAETRRGVPLAWSVGGVGPGGGGPEGISLGVCGVWGVVLGRRVGGSRFEG